MELCFELQDCGSRIRWSDYFRNLIAQGDESWGDMLLGSLWHPIVASDRGIGPGLLLKMEGLARSRWTMCPDLTARYMTYAGALVVEVMVTILSNVRYAIHVCTWESSRRRSKSCEYVEEEQNEHLAT